MKQSLVQRYLSFMAEEISLCLDAYEVVNRIIKDTKEKYPEFAYTLPNRYREREIWSKRVKHMSDIQTKVKRSLNPGIVLEASLVQAMEKQVTMLLKHEAYVKKEVKEEREFYYTKTDYIATLKAVKSREARLVELQQAIRKQKQA